MRTGALALFVAVAGSMWTADGTAHSSIYRFEPVPDGHDELALHLAWPDTVALAEGREGDAAMPGKFIVLTFDVVSGLKSFVELTHDDYEAKYGSPRQDSVAKVQPGEHLLIGWKGKNGQGSCAIVYVHFTQTITTVALKGLRLASVPSYSPNYERIYSQRVSQDERAYYYELDNKERLESVFDVVELLVGSELSAQLSGYDVERTEPVKATKKMVKLVRVPAYQQPQQLYAAFGRNVEYTERDTNTREWRTLFNTEYKYLVFEPDDSVANGPLNACGGVYRIKTKDAVEEKLESGKKEDGEDYEKNSSRQPRVDISYLHKPGIIAVFNSGREGGEGPVLVLQPYGETQLNAYHLRYSAEKKFFAQNCDGNAKAEVVVEVAHLGADIVAWLQTIPGVAEISPSSKCVAAEYGGKRYPALLEVHSYQQVVFAEYTPQPQPEEAAVTKHYAFKLVPSQQPNVCGIPYRILEYEFPSEEHFAERDKGIATAVIDQRSATSHKVEEGDLPVIALFNAGTISGNAATKAQHGPAVVLLGTQSINAQQEMEWELKAYYLRHKKVGNRFRYVARRCEKTVGEEEIHLKNFGKRLGTNFNKLKGIAGLVDKTVPSPVARNSSATEDAPDLDEKVVEEKKKEGP